MSDEAKIDIPEKHQEFCRALARVARAHKMKNLSGSYRTAFGDPWQHDIQFSWEQGRHGEDSDKLFINSNVRVYTRLGPEK